MDRKLIISVAAIALLASFTARAQEHMEHGAHMHAMDGGDGRQLVNFPPEMRRHTLANMRDHLLALSEILSAMSAGQYAEAARVAGARLGSDSPSAEGCKDDAASGKPPMSRPTSMDHQMARYMPEEMRSIGLNMHQAASAFAAEATKADKSGNAKPALAALSQVTRQCAACHAAYKVQ